MVPYVTSNVSSPQTETVYTPASSCTTGDAGGGTLQTSSQVISSVFRRQDVNLYVDQLQNNAWVRVATINSARVYIPTGSSYPYIPPSWGGWITQTQADEMSADGSNCYFPPEPPAVPCNAQNTCYRYYLTNHSIADGAAPSMWTSYIPTGNCSGDSLNGTANVTSVSYSAGSATQHQFARVRVDQLVNGAWAPIYNQSSPMLVLPYDGSHPLGWVPDGWMSQNQALSMATDGSSCTAVCPDPVAENNYKQTCPFGQGTFNCFHPEQSVCQYQTCAQVNAAIIANPLLICPGGEPDRNYQCMETNGQAHVLGIDCKNCEAAKILWGEGNCGAVNLVATYDCATNTGTCKDCAALGQAWANNNCGQAIFVKSFDCATETGTCMTCDEERELFGNAHCGYVGNIGAYDCTTHEGQCRDLTTMDYCSSNYASCVTQCRGERNIASYSCENNHLLVPCSCINNSPAIINGEPSIEGSTGGITPSPSSPSATNDTPEQNQAKVVDNTNAINKTVADGLNNLHSDNVAMQGIMSRISDSLSSPAGIGSNDDGSVADPGDVDMSGVYDSYKNLSSYIPGATLSGIILSGETPEYTFVLSGKSIVFDLSQYEQLLNIAGDILYFGSCFGALVLILL